MTRELFEIAGVSSVLYGQPSDQVYLFIHGKGGCKEEAEAFADIACPAGYQVLAIDLPAHGARKKLLGTFDPWSVVPELREIMAYAQQRWRTVSLRANSIGAYFAMLAFPDLHKALLVSPILDMERLICDMMEWAGVSKEQLQKQGEIPTAFGETLSWRYLTYVWEHPIHEWHCPIHILYAEQDNMTSRKTVDAFVRRSGASLTVVKDSEHWFHTPEQLEVLNRWTQEWV